MPRTSPRALLVVLALACATACSQAPEQLTKSTPPGPQRVLMIGDSIIWGQGLLPEEKIAALIQRAYGNKLAITNIAHSGAIIGTKDQSVVPYPTATPPPYGEIADNFPTIWQQARFEAPHASDFDTIIVDGCINDVGTDHIIAPALGHPLKQLESRTKDFCQDRLTALLTYLLDTYVNHGTVKRIVVLGYFPILSYDSTRSTSLWNILALNAYNSTSRLTPQDIAADEAFIKKHPPGGKAGLVQTGVQKCGLGGVLFQCGVRYRALAWYDWSKNDATAAVGAANAKTQTASDVSMTPAFPLWDTKDSAFTGKSANESALWEVAETETGQPKPMDDVAGDRLRACKDRSDGKTCVILSAGHPNRCGEVLYANAILSALDASKPLLPRPELCVGKTFLPTPTPTPDDGDNQVKRSRTSGAHAASGTKPR